nr:aminotransferase class III-fold pyridoxal phosphate-dependent enzyme [Sneathiella sp. P13V-1]
MLQHWQAALNELWGIEASLTRLDGEYDLNFLASSDSDYVLKVMRSGCDTDFIDMQCRAFAHLREASAALPIPKVIPTINGDLFTSFKDEEGQDRLLWVLERMHGKTYADFKPKTDALVHELGTIIGEIDKNLADFTHSALDRDFKWNLMQGAWIEKDLDVITDPDRKKIISSVLSEFHEIESKLLAMDKVAIHNDVNDYNILVQGTLTEAPSISGIIDLGDMCYAPRICDLAVTAAYMVLETENAVGTLAALVSGYHDAHPLSAEEIDMVWPLLRLRLAVSVVNSTMMAKENPDDPYVVISQKPAWDFLENNNINPRLINKQLRAACGLPITDRAEEITSWLEKERGNFADVLGVPLKDAETAPLSVEVSTFPQNPFEMTDEEAADLDVKEGIYIGFYNEPRLVYTDNAFYNGPFKGSNRRTVHLGVDLFEAAGKPVYAPMDATVEELDNRTGHLDYGGLIVLRHETDEGTPFYTLYGHLNPASIEHLAVGQAVKKGDVIAALGDESHNGGWAPHLHFQVSPTMDGMGADWPGAADPDEMYFWSKMYPNPAALLNVPDEKTRYEPPAKANFLEKRRENFGHNLKLTYSDPVMFLRGWKHHLFDEWGRPYLDSYNNVPHVGHGHPRIQAVAADQLKRMNSNTRYLHPAQTAFADTILKHMPDYLSVCFFVNSGTEANELALRLARAHSGGKDMITPDHGYHGNTTGCIDISAYKFNAPGGIGQSDWVHLVEVADDYRGSFRRGEDDVAEKYAALVDDALKAIETRGGKLAGFIAETFPSVGGQIIPPKGYLAKVYERIRAAGGVCIADEVQTALGRLGDYFFAFEQQEALPDIVVMGKPIGNGHPLGVVVTTRAIADSFAKGPEFFSTFGGSNLSCRMGKEVLDIVEDEGLQQNAKAMGEKLLSGLRKLQDKYEIVGDVRGIGLFIGLDLVTDRETRAPGTEIASYVKNRMRENRILMGSEGPADNILKIRPPITIQSDDVDMILDVMDTVLDEAQSLVS